MKVPQKLGAFSLPDGKAMGEKYGPMTAPTKSGGIKALYPALNWPVGINLNADGMNSGDWHLWDVREGSLMMRDETFAKINATRVKMGVSQISNSTSRWFAERCNVGYAWHFYGYLGYLSNISYNVSHGDQVGAVTLLKYKN